MPPDTPRPAYFIAHLRVPEVERYRREYGRKVLAQVAGVGAKLRARGQVTQIIVGAVGMRHWVAREPGS